MKHSHIIVGILLCASPLPSLAYIDPGSGSALISGIIGFSVIVTMVIKSYWYQFRHYLKNLFHKKDVNQISEKEKV